MSKGLKKKEEEIIERIYMVRNHRVMLDRDLAELYGVETRVLKQAVRRNIDRFPSDFMFEMSKDEFDTWRSQNVMSKADRKGWRYAPFCFTEQGVTMLSCILNSKKAIEVNLQIVRIFTKLREMLLSNKEILLKLEKIDKRLINLGHDVQMHDDEIEAIFKLIDQMREQRVLPRSPIGFKTKSNTKRKE